MRRGRVQNAHGSFENFSFFGPNVRSYVPATVTLFSRHTTAASSPARQHEHAGTARQRFYGFGGGAGGSRRTRTRSNTTNDDGYARLCERRLRDGHVDRVAAEAIYTARRPDRRSFPSSNTTASARLQYLRHRVTVVRLALVRRHVILVVRGEHDAFTLAVPNTYPLTT